MLNESRPTGPSCKAAALQTLHVISGERIWEEAPRNARLKGMKDCAQKEKLRTKQSRPNDAALMPLQKESGHIIKHPPNLPLDYYPMTREPPQDQDGSYHQGRISGYR